MDSKDIVAIIQALGVFAAAVFSGIAAIYAAKAKYKAEEAARDAAVVKLDVAVVKTDTVAQTVKIDGIAQAVVEVKGSVTEVKGSVVDMKREVKLIEVNTNSMKDALVKVTGEAAFAAGGEAERAKVIASEAVFAAGKEAARAESVSSPSFSQPSSIPSVVIDQSNKAIDPETATALTTIAAKVAEASVAQDKEKGKKE